MSVNKSVIPMDLTLDATHTISSFSPPQRGEGARRADEGLTCQDVGQRRHFESTLIAVLDAGHEARFVARGDSMHPTIRDGEAVRIERCTSVNVGDIVLARTVRGLTAHRVIRVEGRRITTRGDNAPRPDAPFDTNELIGRVKIIERKQPAPRLFDERLTLFRLLRRIFHTGKAIRPRFR